MQDLYGLGASGVPIEYSAQMRALQQQQMIAQSMLQQSQDPLANQAPGVAVSPTQGLAKMVQAYIGAKGMQNAAQGITGAATKYNDDQSNAMNKVTQAMAPSPAVPIPMANATGTEGQMIPKTAQEKQAAVQQAMMSQFPNVRQFGTAMNNNLQSDVVREDNQQFRTDTLKAQQEQRTHEIKLAQAEQLRKESAAAEEKEKDRIAQKELKTMIAGGFAKPDSVVVQTPEGVFAFDKRSQKLTPLMHNGKQIVGSTSSPELQGEIAGAKTGQEAQAKRNFNMTGLGDTINEAKSILSGGGGALPTGSGAGVARDAVAGFFGASTAGAEQAQKLKALSGALTSKMPRMEGPQSDKDVAMYKEMSGLIGDDSVPVARRKAALDTVEKLWSKYEPGNKPAAPSGSFDAGKEQRYQAWKKSQGL